MLECTHSPKLWVKPVIVKPSDSSTVEDSELIPIAISMNPEQFCVCETRSNDLDLCGLTCEECQNGVCRNCDCRKLIKFDSFHNSSLVVETSLIPIHEGLLLDEEDIRQLLSCNIIYSVSQMAAELPVVNLARPREVRTPESLLLAMNNSPWFILLPLEDSQFIDLFTNVDSVDRTTNQVFEEPSVYILHLSLSFTSKVCS
ncbi:hypothetical protein GEMRC1_005242 [Eukaryota sp. GEM-RC1]